MDVILKYKYSGLELLFLCCFDSGYCLCLSFTIFISSGHPDGMYKLQRNSKETH
uniref:Uncharacterized protein n=1 Tax=Periophthalmus magnuspinnatus TaxID=409849 RepID=A0A3B4AUP6_9GOBI